jgi:hypothetical protein
MEIVDLPNTRSKIYVFQLTLKRKRVSQFLATEQLRDFRVGLNGGAKSPSLSQASMAWRCTIA